MGLMVASIIAFVAGGLASRRFGLLSNLVMVAFAVAIALLYLLIGRLM